MGRVGTEAMADARRCVAPPPFFLFVFGLLFGSGAKVILGLAEV